MIPVYGIGFVTSHAGKQHPAGIRLPVYIIQMRRGPVIIGLELVLPVPDLQSAGWTQGLTSAAPDAFRVVTIYCILIAVIFMDIIGTLPYTDFTGYTFILISFYFEFRLL
jgi:hypothetical protein